VKVLKKRKKHKRGYPIAILVGIEETHSVIWKIFSRIVKPIKTLYLEGTRSNPKALYNFHELTINTLRPPLKEGTRSIILVSPQKTTFSIEFAEHIRHHHKWLIQGPNKAEFAEITGSATKLSHVYKLTRSPIFQQIINLITAEETENLIELLEKLLNTSENENCIIFSLEEIETQIINKNKPDRIPEYLLITDKYLSESKEKSRLHRLMQIAANRKIKIRVVNAESPAGTRLSQLGGIVGMG